MTATLAPPAGAQLAHLSPETIDITEGFNPRTSMDDAKLAEITASVAKVGVIQPVIVTRSDDRYTLVVGHRRLAAATAANVPNIPALVYECIDEAARLQLAIIENLQREDINAIDEAAAFQRAITEHGLTQKQLADVVGKSASHVSERLRLLKLPPECQQHIAHGRVPLTAVKTLAQIAKVAPAVADGCARLVATGEAEGDDLISEPQYVVGMLTDVDWDDAPFVQPVYRYSTGSPIRLGGHLPEDEIAALTERAHALQFTRYAFDNDDIDAARAYKCLLEFGEGHSAHRFVTDARFTFDRISLALDRIEAQHARELAAQTDEPIPGDASADEPRDSASRLRQIEERRKTKEHAERRKQREHADKARLDAITANRQLGLNLAKKLGAKTVDREVAELLARIVLAQNSQLAGRGIRYTHDEFHTVERLRQKNGNVRTKFTAADSTQAQDKLIEWVLRPKPPEEMIGRLLQALIAGTIADHNAVAQSQRIHWHTPSPVGSDRVEQLIAKLAAKLAPEHFRPTIQQMLPEPKAKRTPRRTAAKNPSPGESKNGADSKRQASGCTKTATDAAKSEAGARAGAGAKANSDAA